jgi:hypothetical protein
LGGVLPTPKKPRPPPPPKKKKKKKIQITSSQNNGRNRRNTTGTTERVRYTSSRDQLADVGEIQLFSFCFCPVLTGNRTDGEQQQEELSGGFIYTNELYHHLLFSFVSFSSLALQLPSCSLSLSLLLSGY